jgi:two-component system, OmpR family, response regulator VanR
VIRVLLVEDERPLAAALARWLRRQGMAVDVADDGESALAKARLVPYDVVVLDRHLPVLHGDEVCRRLVADGAATRILMLTAADSTDELVGGLDLGADDYLVKPVVLAELEARLRALARRTASPAPPVLRRGDLELDSGGRTVRRAGRSVKLAPREFDLLEALLRAEGRALSTDVLRRRLWDERFEPFDNTVRVTLGRLRRKLGDPPLIETVTGSGYRIA